MSDKPACQDEACQLQDCLWKNDFQEARCKRTLQALEKCCNELLDNGGSSRCCPSRKSNKNNTTGQSK
ncbi:hypothetical protein H4S08_000399 [Coemansia sp. RSA 1365]|nr:hypothetical protein H4S08_000399 [Coemansia sp. RSA 1365]